MKNIFQIISSLFFHAVIIIGVYERFKTLLKAIKQYKETKKSGAIKVEILLFILVLILAFVIYRAMIYGHYPKVE